MLTLNQPGRYVAYLLRCWGEPGDDAVAPLAWRFSLEDPHTGHRRGFANLERLVETLAHELAAGPAGAGAPALPKEDAPDDQSQDATK